MPRSTLYKTMLTRLDELYAPLKAVWFALDLYSAVQDDRLTSRAKDELVELWHLTLKDKGWNDCAERQADYATYLASYPGELSFEDMYKLVMTLQEVGVLEALGLHLGSNRRIEMTSAVEKRFLNQPSLARAALGTSNKDWSTNWWYNQIL